MASTTPAEVWIADDGELADVRQLLDRLGVAHGPVPRDPECPEAIPQLFCSLLFTTPAQAVTLQPAIVRSDALHVVVIDEVPRTLRRMLERCRCDFVLQRPIHPGMLRLLVTHALYSGPEKRRAGRVLIGEPVTFKAGLLSKNATLIELSDGGCSLETKQPVDADTSVQITLPRQLTGGKALTVEGRVVSRAPLPGHGRSHRLSVAFVSTAGVRRELRTVLRAHAQGAAALRAESGAGGVLKLDPAGRKGATGADKGSHAPQVERRRHPRRRYRKPVLATSRGGGRTLIGGDLSRGGMRVVFDPDLSVGDELKLAIYGTAGQAPLVVRAAVVRADDESFGLEFHNVGDRAGERLEKLVQSLPDLPGGRPRKPGQVMSEILDEDGD